jgi:L-fuconolactonase
MIDAHQHFWRIGRNGCVWPPPELAAIHRDVEPDELTAIASTLDVQGSVLVQSQPDDRDTDYLLDLAAGEPFVQAVVGWTNLAAPGAPARIAELARRPKLKGLRPMLQGLPDDWILDPAIEPGIEAMQAHGLRLDALVCPRHLPSLTAFASRHPGLAVVIDHAAKPAIASGALDPWRASIAELAAMPQVCCKLSGLLTEAGPGARPAHLEPYVAHLLDIFGPERLMWGSDWPVLELAGRYGDWLAICQDFIRPLGPSAMTWVFEGASRRFYAL